MHPEPAGQPAEHDIGEEREWLNDRRVERLHELLYPARVGDISEHKTCCEEILSWRAIGLFVL